MVFSLRRLLVCLLYLDVEYLSNPLTTAGYAVSYIYDSLEQFARTFQGA